VFEAEVCVESNHAMVQAVSSQAGTQGACVCCEALEGGRSCFCVCVCVWWGGGQGGSLGAG
jgi:hypothetical protein